MKVHDHETVLPFAQGALFGGLIGYIFLALALIAFQVHVLQLPSYQALDHRLDALRAEKVRALTAPSAVYLCEEWFCDGAVALPDMCETEGGTLRRTGAWIGVTDTLTLSLRRPGMMSFRLCNEREVKPEPCGALAFCGGGDE